MSDSERAELQSHYPYMGVKLNELSVQEERLILMYLRGMTKAAAGRAAGYQDVDTVYDIFKKPKIIPQVVETVAAYPSQVRAKISSQGTIRPEHEILITSEVAGKVEWISPKFLDGAGFNLGDTLMKIEKRDYELALITTESSLFQAKLALEREQAESKLANIEWKRVGKGDASSLTLREPQLAQARAVLAAAEAAYEQSKRNLRRTVILAPFDGRVRKKMVDIGANLVPGSRIADIYNTLNLEVRLPIADKDIPFLGVPLDGTSLLKAKLKKKVESCYNIDDIEPFNFIRFTFFTYRIKEYFIPTIMANDLILINMIG